MAGKDFRLAEEIDYIQGPAADRDGCLVTVGPLVLFSTETGDAWLLDPADHLAGRLARDGEAFVYIDNDTARVTAILGYPTRRLAQLG